MTRKYNLDFNRLRESELRGGVRNQVNSSNTQNSPFQRPTNSRQESYGNQPSNSPYRNSNSLLRGNSSGVSEKLSEFMKKLPMFAITIATFFGTLFRSVLIVLGVMAINIADSAMGALGLSFMFNNRIAEYTLLSDVTLGLVFSLGLSATQIYMWMIIQKRGIHIRHLWQWKRIPSDVKNFLFITFGLWIIDTFIDTSPLAVVMTNENFVSNPVLYQFLSISVYIVTIVLCGFAELITSNMKEMFENEKSI